MVEIFKNDTKATATDLGTLAFTSNLPTEVIAKTNIWTFDHVFSLIDPLISDDIYDYYSFDPFQLASVTVSFHARSTGDYADYVTGAHPVSGPVFMQLFGFRSVGLQSRSASSFRAMNAAGFRCSRSSIH
ncbi:MAG: hypothetical protein ABJP66_19465 [Hyphomicrobiales bacterium]